jgi:regulator of CtrA degradation
MAEPLTINPRIVEALYSEALVLSDEVRNAFALSGRLERLGADEDLARVALSSEGLRTTTRMMHAIAWLLNHRAFFKGEISELQLLRNGRLAPEMRRLDPRHAALLAPEVGALVKRTRQFYDRLLRLDDCWRPAGSALADGALGIGSCSAIERLRERIESRLAS